MLSIENTKFLNYNLKQKNKRKKYAIAIIVFNGRKEK